MRFEADAPFAIDHVELLRSSYRHWTGKHLLPPEMSPIDAQGALYDAPFALLSHDAAADPVFNYGNRRALELLEMTWDELLVTPSRLTTEPGAREERRRLLDQVSSHGHIDNYSGVRVSKRGRRFTIKDATVWNVIDAKGKHHGQAALIRAWEISGQSTSE